MKKDLLLKLSEIKLFLFDLDGVLINSERLNKENSEMMILNEIISACIEFSRYGAKFGIVTARKDDDLIIELKSKGNCFVLSSSLEKVSAVDKLAQEYELDYKNIFYMGDDILDIPLLKKCGLSAVPSNAKREVKRVAHILINSENAQQVFKQIFELLEKSRSSIIGVVAK